MRLTWNIGRRILALLAGVLAVMVSGCDRQEPAGRTAGRYATLVSTGAVAPAPAARPASGVFTEGALLSVLQTELTPATLWRTSAREVTWWGRVDASGLGGPTFLAYSSPTGIAVTRPGAVIAGDQFRENWMLVGYPGSTQWTDWDSPQALFLQRKPQTVRFDDQGVHGVFEGPAGTFALMPLYGYFKPHQQGRGVLPEQGLKERELFTWEWAIVVARDPLTRLRYWAGGTRRFPWGANEVVSVEPARDRVRIRQVFDWIEVPDEWNTRGLHIAPLSPALGLVIRKGESFPLEFSKAPFDFDLPTPFGPWHGIPEVAEHEATLPLLRYLHETRWPGGPPSQPSTGLTEALGQARRVVLERFGAARDPGAVERTGPVRLASEILWAARAIPWLEAGESNAVRSTLGAYLREDLLAPGRFRETGPEGGPGRRVLGLADAAAAPTEANATLLMAVWTYAHASGDYGLVAERWGLLSRLDPSVTSAGWPGEHGSEGVAGGWAATAALGAARLAYLAGDAPAYVAAARRFAIELIHLQARERGASWVRERQPWDSMEPIPVGAALGMLAPGGRGWTVEVATNPAARPSLNPLRDPDLERFLVDRRAAGGKSTAAGGSSAGPAPVPEGLPAVVAEALAAWQREGVARTERLIGGAGTLVGGPSSAIPSHLPHLLHELEVLPGTWPRVTWGRWRTPAGSPWTFGEIRLGTASAPPSAPRRTLISPQTVRWEW